MNNTQKYVKKYGKQYENLIISCLNWLERNEPLWMLSKPIDKDNFIKEIIERTSLHGKN